MDDDNHLHGHGIKGPITLFCVLVAATATGYWVIHKDFPAMATKHKQRVAETELAALGHEAERRKQQLQRNQQLASSTESVVQFQALAGNAYLTAKPRCSVHAHLTVASFATNEYEDISAKVETALKACDGQPEMRSQIHYVSGRARDGQALRVINNRPLSRPLENEALSSYDLSGKDNEAFSPVAALQISAIILRRPKPEVTAPDLKMAWTRVSDAMKSPSSKNAGLVNDLVQEKEKIQGRLTELEAEKAAARNQHTVKSKSIHKKKTAKKAETGLRKKSHGAHKKARSHNRHHVDASWPGILTPYCERSTRQGRRLAGRRGCQRMAGATFRGYSRNAPVVFFQYR